MKLRLVVALMLTVGCLCGNTVTQNPNLDRMFMLAAVKEQKHIDIKAWIGIETLEKNMRQTEWTHWKIAMLLFVSSSICLPIVKVKTTRRLEESRTRQDVLPVSLSMYLHNSGMMYYKAPLSERVLTAATFLDRIPKCLFPE